MGDTEEYLEEIKNITDYSHILKDLNYTVTELPTGIFQYTACPNRWDVPVGLVWLRYRSNHEEENVAEILHCYTIEWGRRYGICKYLFNSILENKELDLLVTQNGSETGGEGFLKDFGFKYNKEIGLWHYRVKK